MMRGRLRLFNLWTPRSCTTTMTTSDSPFMEDYSSEDYDDDYDVVPNNDPTIECNEVFAPEVPNAAGTEEAEEAEEAEEVEAPIARLPLSFTMVKTSWEMSQTTVPPSRQCPEYLSMEVFLSSAALFVLQECRTTIKSWIERFLSQLERLRIRFYSALRTLIRKPFVWASRKHD